MGTGISPFFWRGGSGKMEFTALGKGWTILKMAVWFLSLVDFDSIISQTFAQISHFLEVEKSNYTSVTSVAMHEWNSVSFPVQWFVVGEMTCPFEKYQNGVRFGKCFPHFTQLWSSKCFSSANNAVIRTENCKLQSLTDFDRTVTTTADAAAKWSGDMCAGRMKMVKVRVRDVDFIWLCQQGLERKIVHLSRWMNLYPDSVNQCSFSFIMRMPSVCKQPPGIGFGPKAGNWDLVYPPSGPSYNIVVILYKYPNWCSDSSIA